MNTKNNENKKNKTEVGAKQAATKGQTDERIRETPDPVVMPEETKVSAATGATSETDVIAVQADASFFANKQASEPLRSVTLEEQKGEAARATAPDEPSPALASVIAAERREESDAEQEDFFGADPQQDIAEGSEESDPLEFSSEDIEDIFAAKESLKKQKNPKKESRKKRKKRERLEKMLDPSCDIRYRGPLSYRSFRILAWICIVLSQAASLLGLVGKIDAGVASRFSGFIKFAPIISSLMTPLFLVATFAIILNDSRKIVNLLVMYAGFSAVFYVGFVMLHDRYAAGLLMRLMEVGRPEAITMLDGMLAKILQNGYIGFNIFIDLFLCTLFTYFMLYHPKKVFVGKKIIIFRLFSLLPVAYEVASITVKVLASIKIITVSPYVYPLLTTKPPLSFIAFILLTVFIKNREWLFRKNGKTREEYKAYLKTNRNSLQFTKFASHLFAIVSFVDLILVGVLSIAIEGRFVGMENASATAANAVFSWGIGSSVPLLLVIPLLWLFSYTRTYKDTRLDLLINLAGVGAVVLVYLEFFYRALLSGIDILKEMFMGLL